MFGLKAEFTNLLDLQKIDSEIDKLNNDLVNIEEKACYGELQEKIKKAKEKERLYKEEQNRQNQSLDKLNGELDLLSQKIDREKKKLYSGTVSNPKELSSIEKEIASLSGKRDDLETKVLEQMDKVSLVDNGVSKIDEAIANDTKEAEAANETWQQKDSHIKSKLIELKTSRGAQAKKVDDELLADYEDIRATKGGIGAGALIKGVCQVCNVELPMIDVEEIKSKDRPEYCISCDRILIVKE